MADLKRHHKKQSFCASRPKYREARWERAVKVYTVNMESKYLLVQGIPALNLTKDLLEMFAVYGVIDEYRIMDDYPAEEFTKTYWIKFQDIMAARKAKKKVDNWSFFGGILHVTYAPEFESVEETKEKLMERKRIVQRKLNRTSKRFEEQRTTQYGDQERVISLQEQPTTSTKQPCQEVRAGAPEIEASPSKNNYTGTTNTDVDEGDEYLPERLPSLLPDNPYPSQIPTASLTWNRVQFPIKPQTYNSPVTKTLFAPDKTRSTKATEGYPNLYNANRHNYSNPDNALTGDSSLDRTVLAIREKLQQVSHPSSSDFRNTEFIGKDSKRSLPASEVLQKAEKKKQRKRI